MAIRDELLDELLKEYKNPEDLFGKDGIFKELKKCLIEMRWTLKSPTTWAMKSTAPPAKTPAIHETVNLLKSLRAILVRSQLLYLEIGKVLLNPVL